MAKKPKKPVNETYLGGDEVEQEDAQVADDAGDEVDDVSTDDHDEILPDEVVDDVSQPPAPPERHEMTKDEVLAEDNKLAHQELDEIAGMVGKIRGNNVEDVLHTDYGMNRIHVQLITEMIDKKPKGKLQPFSDGMRALIHKEYLRLKKAQKI